MNLQPMFSFLYIPLPLFLLSLSFLDFFPSPFFCSFTYHSFITVYLLNSCAVLTLLHCLGLFAHEWHKSVSATSQKIRKSFIEMSRRYLRISTYSWTTKNQERKGQGQFWGLLLERIMAFAHHVAIRPGFLPYQFPISKRDSDWLRVSQVIASGPISYDQVVGSYDASLHVHLEVMQDLSREGKSTRSLDFTLPGAHSHMLGMKWRVCYQPDKCQAWRQPQGRVFSRCSHSY